MTGAVDPEPEIASWGEGRLDRLLRWPGGSGRHRAWTLAAAVSVCLLVAVIASAIMVSHRDQRIHQLEAALRSARQAVTSPVGFPASSATAIRAFPDKAGGSFTMITAQIAPRFGTEPLTWLFLYGKGIPGHRYGLLGGSCHNGPITYDWADGIAGQNGDLAIVADNLAINPVDPHLWVLIHPLGGTEVLGGTTGPFLQPGAASILTAQPC